MAAQYGMVLTIAFNKEIISELQIFVSKKRWNINNFSHHEPSTISIACRRIQFKFFLHSGATTARSNVNDGENNVLMVDYCFIT